MVFWYGPWGFLPWLLIPILMCAGMMAMILVMGRGHTGQGWMGWCGDGHRRERDTDPALDALRQRLASGELTREEYEEQRKLLLTT